MSYNISRQELKKNELADFVINAVTAIRNKQPMFLSIAGIVLGVILFSLFVFVRYRSAKAYALDKLAIAQGQLYQGQSDQALKMLDEIINQHSRSEIAAQSRLTKAEFFVSRQNYAEAENVLLPLTTKEKPKQLVPMALAALGAVRENGGKFPEAISTYNSFVEKYPGHYMAPKIYESLARLYELTQSPAQAKTIYEKIVTLYPSTGWAARAQERVAALSSVPSQTPPPQDPSNATNK